MFSKLDYNSAKKKKNIMEFAGAWSFLNKKTAEQIEKVANRARKNWRAVHK